jgi:hypothetical protein
MRPPYTTIQGVSKRALQLYSAVWTVTKTITFEGLQTIHFNNLNDGKFVRPQV